MNHDYKYSFQRILLKPLEYEDIERLRVLRNQNRHCFIAKQEITKNDQEKWYQSYLKKKDDIMFKIVKKDEPDNFIGAVALYDINRKAKTAEFGRIVIDKLKVPERGIGTEVTTAACLFGFETLSLERIVCDVLVENDRAIRTYQHVGFRITGVRVGMYHMAVTRNDIISRI